MTAVDAPITIEQGATFVMSFTWSLDDPDNPGNPGDPVDLTGATIRMQIRKNQQSAILAEATSDGPNPLITHTGPSGGITVKLPASVTDDITSKSCLYDLEVAMPNGDVFRVLSGQVTVSPNITQTADDPVVGA